MRSSAATSKYFNPFKHRAFSNALHHRTDPKEIFNVKLYFVVFAAVFSGMFYGFDTGNIGGVLTLPAFKHAFGFDGMTTAELDVRKGDIAAMGQLTSHNY